MSLGELAMYRYSLTQFIITLKLKICPRQLMTSLRFVSIRFRFVCQLPIENVMLLLVNYVR